MRRGFTLVELLIALIMVGILAGLVAPRLSGWRDRLAVSRAAGETALFYHRLRYRAVLGSAMIRMEFTPAWLTAWAERGVDSLVASQPGPERHGVALGVSRSVIRLAPNGLGYGAANTKLVFRRGAVAESLTVSRLGRLKRWR